MAGYIGSKASVVSSGAERKKTFTITGATTSLTGLNYTVGKVHVFQNGVRLVDGTDYTATNGTTITLTAAAQNGDNVVVISQASFQVADALLTTGGTLTGDLTVGGNILVEKTGNPTITNKTTGAGNNPSYRLQADTNYWDFQGTFSNANDELFFMYNGSPKMGIDSSGKVGIGTNSPNATLTVSQGANNIFAVERTGVSNGSGQFGINIESNSQATVSYDDGAPLVFGTASSPSTHAGFTERMKIDASGRVTKPYQPSFRATSGAANTASAALVFTQKDFDVSNSYSTSTGRFTAPLAGTYLFYITALYSTGGTSPTWKVSWEKNGSFDAVVGEYQSTFNSTSSYHTIFNSTITMSLASGDYVNIKNMTNQGVHISGTQTKFGGYLLG